jgi:glycosyltransferase involved in cell wall biosynthesis
MRIVYVLTSLGMGGAERQVLALATRMEERGHAIALMILRPQLKEQWPTTLDVVHLGMRRNPLSVAAGLFRGRRFLTAFRPELVHSHSFHANLIARMLKFFFPSMVVVSTVHNVYEGGWIRMLAYRLTDGLSRRTAAVSKAAAERFVELKAVPQRKCVVVTNGIDAAEFAPQEQRRAAMRATMGVTSEFVWMTAGRIVPAKDLPNLMKAFVKVRASNLAAQLWIAGEGNRPGVGSVSGFVAVSGSFRWLGLRRDLPALLDAADGFVLASAWEGMPLVVGEAMAMSKAVVATDVGGVRELVADTGVIVPAHDSDALSAGMLRVMAMPLEDREKLGESARARIIAHFSMDARAAEWQALYADVLGRCK